MDHLTRTVSTRIEAELEGTADLYVAIAVAQAYRCASEHFHARIDGMDIGVDELVGPHGNRTHLLRAVPPGALTIEYRAAVRGGTLRPDVDELERLQYLLPSRYCQSDELAAVAASEFGQYRGLDLLQAISTWVHAHIGYVIGSSRPIDGAISTLLARQGVCRDFAHLTTALLRANDTPARVVAVYAPGLDPMDFHAVTEALIDDQWHVVDSTGLAPRQSMVRIATGADAAHTAFLTNIGGGLTLSALEVTAIVDPGLPMDDGSMALHLR